MVQNEMVGGREELGENKYLIPDNISNTSHPNSMGKEYQLVT